MTQARVAGAPVIVVAIAFALALVSDRLLYVGPLDRASFGWIVVFPLWAAAPMFAGFAWRDRSPGERTRFAAVGALIVGGVGATLLWLTAAAPAIGCTPTRTPLELIPPASAVAAVIGGGFGLACRIASGEVAAGHVGRGAIYGAVLQLLVIPSASMLFFVSFFGMCQRP